MSVNANLWAALMFPAFSGANQSVKRPVGSRTSCTDSQPTTLGLSVRNFVPLVNVNGWEGTSRPVFASARSRAVTSCFCLKEREQHLHHDVEQLGV